MYSQEIIVAVFASIFGLSGVTLASVGITIQEPLAPLSASFVAGAFLFVLMFGTSLGSLTQMVAVFSEGLKGVEFLDQRHYTLFAIIVLSSWYGYLGTDLLLRHWPNVLPPTCLDEQWGFQCTNCTCMEGICADGPYGNGKCSCLRGWTDDKCDVCGDRFTCTWRSTEYIKNTGDSVQQHSVYNNGKPISGGYWDIRCSGNYVGKYCLQCAIGYVGDTCTDCAPRYEDMLKDSALEMKVCVCNQGIGPNCIAQPNCKLYDYNGTNRAIESGTTNVKDKSLFESSGVNCDYNQDCSTLWCLGKFRSLQPRRMLEELPVKDNYCVMDRQGEICENRQCSIISQYKDATCICSPGFVGPECKPCPGMAPSSQYSPYSPVEREYKLASAFICNGGTCAWQGGSAKCTRCPIGWSGEFCQCEGSIGMCTECSPYYFGPECKPCPGVDGAVGVSKWACGIGGRCDYGVRGSGNCQCKRMQGIFGYIKNDADMCVTCERGFIQCIDGSCKKGCPALSLNQF